MLCVIISEVYHLGFDRVALWAVIKSSRPLYLSCEAATHECNELQQYSETYFYAYIVAVVPACGILEM